MKRLPVIACSLFALMAATPLQGADWTRFRGPDGLGVSKDTGLPVKWSKTENLVWRTELPGAGSSSPIVLNERIYLTCYTGYGVSEDEPGDVGSLSRHVLCLDRKTGKILWKKDFKAGGGESRYSGNGARHGFSTSTPTTDGEFLYVFFGKDGVYCLKLNDGSQVWHASVGDKVADWGSSNSPILYKNLLIVNAAIESNSLIALDKKTGKEAWKTAGIQRAWNTPIVVSLKDGKDELVLSTPGRGRRGAGKIIGFDPLTGKQLWTCDGIADGYICPSVVAHDGVIYATGGRKNMTVAVKAGGRGDVTESHRVWSVPVGSKVGSPSYHNGYLYFVHDGRGTAVCLDAKTGKTVYQQRLSPRPGIVYSSITIADGKIYSVSQHNGTYVFAAGPKFELLAHNKFEDDGSRANASVIVSNNQILIRSNKFLSCVGSK